MTVYSASKSYVNYLALAVEKEVVVSTGTDSIDWQILCPNFVETQMAEGVFGLLRKVTSVSVERCVNASIRQLG